MKVNNFCAHLECFSIYCDKKDHPQEEVARRVAVYLSPPSAGGRCYKLRTSDPNISIPTREFVAQLSAAAYPGSLLRHSLLAAKAPASVGSPEP